jgi:hypothetical protein
MFEDIVKLINALTALFTVIGPIIMYVMKKKYDREIARTIRERDSLAKAINEIDRDPKTNSDSIWVQVERWIDSRDRSRLIPVLKNLSSDTADAPTSKAD